MDLLSIMKIYATSVFFVFLHASVDYNQKLGQWFYKLKIQIRIKIWETIETNLERDKILGSEEPTDREGKSRGPRRPLG